MVVEAWCANNGARLAFLNYKLSKIDGIQQIDSLHGGRMIKYTYDWGSARRRGVTQDTMTGETLVTRGRGKAIGLLAALAAANIVIWALAWCGAHRYAALLSTGILAYGFG